MFNFLKSVMVLFLWCVRLPRNLNHAASVYLSALD
jgi:hypothetical protein